MFDPFEELILYLRAAQAFKAKLQMPDRDRALVMAGACATHLQMAPIAEFCRKLVLQHNPGHMLRKYDSYQDAVQDSDFGVLVKSIRRKLTPELAESQLVALGYQCDVRQSDYQTKREYAAAVMGVDASWIEEHFG